MKKIIALALSLMLLLGCASAPAESADTDTLTMMGAFEIKYKALPEYYSLNVGSNNDMEFTARIIPSDDSRPWMFLYIGFSDEWDGVNTLADATEEDMAAVKDSFYEVTELNEGDILFEDGETGLGTKLLIARDKDGSFAAVYAIYMSHEIEVDLYPSGENGTISDEDVNTVIAFLTDVEFIPLEK
jgi:hypothetical protein